ncbi:MAG: hypothetical protein CMH48_00985 [Muricauda sp.]|jgi:ketosteroid isomerase-like protein|nr:hypothetical protein [Allomuricauda sp.]MBC29396.1 hypothetical protein [Allomuricauda sp.]|tara:strand:- start:197 stop:700 length:504 start_codon:yes stop_codon:yes gene_type:complete
MKNILMLFLVLGYLGFAQKRDSNPNAVYEKFSEAYATLDADILLDCYTDDAALLNLYDGSNPNSIKTAVKIKDYFAKFFGRFEGSGKKLKLSFKITDRETIGETVYDNGYYKLSVISNNQIERTSYGKLSTILKFKDGNWKFVVDSNSNTDEEEYNKAKVSSIMQPN